MEQNGSLVIVITVLCTLMTVGVSLTLILLFNWRREIKKETDSIWNRVNHHTHNGEGRVVITES